MDPLFMSEATGPDHAHRAFFCKWCDCKTLVCRPCDRGNSYCSLDCSNAARRHQLRRIRSDHQRTPRGAELHRARQRAYRLRLKATVTDHSASGAPRSTAPLSPPRETASQVAKTSLVARAREASCAERIASLRCSLCDRPVSEWVRVGRPAISSRSPRTRGLHHLSADLCPR